MLKIIGGRYKGMKIPSKKNASYRPSTGKVKEAIFSILSSGNFGEQNIFLGASVLDLFAGTGSLGLECLSRGALCVTFNDVERANLEQIQNCIEVNNINGQIKYSNFDGLKLPKSTNQFDVIFIDPPYSLRATSKILANLANKNWTKPGAILVVEFSTKETIILGEGYKLMVEKQYGSTNLNILQYE